MIPIEKRQDEPVEPCDVKGCPDPGRHHHAFDLCDHHERVLYPVQASGRDEAK